MLVGIERSEPLVNVARRRSQRRRAFRGCIQEIAIDSDDVDEAVERGSEVTESIAPCRLDGIVLDLAALNIQQPSQVKDPVVAAREIRPKINRRRQPAAPAIGGIEALRRLRPRWRQRCAAPSSEPRSPAPSRNGGGL